MSSLRQIEANRRNSQRSTGPRSPEGKPSPITGAVSRFNALKSGINAKAEIIPGEDSAELQAMADGYHRDWAPTNSYERFLVDSLIRADWLLQRLARLEAETWTHKIEAARALTFSKLDENSPIGDVYGRHCDQFTRLQRRLDSTARVYSRCVTELQRLRRGLDDTDGPGPEPHPEIPAPPDAPPASPFPSPENPAAAPESATGELASFGQPGVLVPTPEALCFRKHPEVRPSTGRMALPGASVLPPQETATAPAVAVARQGKAATQH